MLDGRTRNRLNNMIKTFVLQARENELKVAQSILQLSDNPNKEAIEALINYSQDNITISHEWLDMNYFLREMAKSLDVD